ncbi:hypothetical protein J3454_14380 [Erythrobacter sp. NFXS35]|uniref:hypothetical protein n=1 Tax=Erythrobacter sp. NFXS35 TaxID=2818436 RepID=UPI0032DFC99E
MTAIREQIFAAVETRLAAIISPAVAEVVRMPSGDPSRFPALFIFDQGDRPAEEEEETDTMAFVMSLGIDGFVNGDAPHSAANALYSAVVEALFPQPVLGGLATEIRVSRLDMAVAETARDHRLGFALELTILYHTRFGEPQEPA